MMNLKMMMLLAVIEMMKVNITIRDDDNLENENDDGSGGPAGNALLQSQVRVRGPVQHGHPAPHQHPQDHVGESDQGNKTQMWVIVRQAVVGWQVASIAR